MVTMTRARGRPGRDPIPLELRFRQYVDASAGPDDCHPFTGYRDPNGYGRIGSDDPGRVELAHRVAWRLAHPDEPLPRVVRHSCDNPPCCNPRHLLAGTQRENLRDAVDRGRHRPPRGIEHHRAVLDEAAARRIAALRVDGLTYQQIADVTGATRSQVADIVTGRAWAHLELPLVARRYRPRRPAEES